jgi:glycosyltransferase involved in cell wall biosynthesis
MRLLFVQETDWLKRNPAQQHHLAEMFSLRGHEIRAIDFEFLWRTNGGHGLYSPRQVFPDVCKIYPGAHVTVIRPGIVRLPILDYVSLIITHWNEIAWQIHDFKPDAVVGWGILNSAVAVLLAHKHNIPFLYYWIDVLDRLIPAHVFQGLGKNVEKYALKRADLVLAINDKLKDCVVRLGAPETKTSVLRAGVDIRRFDPTAYHGEVRGKYGLKEQDKVIFFMGWLYNFSGLKEVANELVKIADDNLKLLIVGEGDVYDDLECIKRESDLGDRLILTGKVPYEEIPGLISAADVCILPAYPYEPIMQDIVPIKLYEYMAMQKPVVVTRLPGIYQEFGEGNGVIYGKSPEDVLNIALQVLANGSKDTGLKARRFVEQNSWDKITGQFESVVKEMIEKIKGRQAA